MDQNINNNPNSRNNSVVASGLLLHVGFAAYERKPYPIAHFLLTFVVKIKLPSVVNVVSNQNKVCCLCRESTEEECFVA